MTGVLLVQHIADAEPKFEGLERANGSVDVENGVAGRFADVDPAAGIDIRVDTALFHRGAHGRADGEASVVLVFQV